MTVMDIYTLVKSLGKLVAKVRWLSLSAVTYLVLFYIHQQNCVNF